jgi:hypothetical protein
MSQLVKRYKIAYNQDQKVEPSFVAWENRIQFFLENLLRVWFNVIVVVGIPYLLFIIIMFLLKT